VRPDDRADIQLAAELCAALARDPRVHELGIGVTVIARQRWVYLDGVVATEERRAQIGLVVEELLPGFEVRNDVAVLGMESPDEETVA
jgi:hypothetical protein